MNPSINRKREKDRREFIQLAGYIESSAQSKENLIQRTKQSINQLMISTSKLTSRLSKLPMV